MEVLLVLEKGYKYALFQGSLIKKSEREREKKEIPWIKSKGERGASLFQLLTHSSSGLDERKGKRDRFKKRERAHCLPVALA